jgi:biotin operon repressor
MFEEGAVEKKILAMLGGEFLSTSEIAKRLNMRRELVAGYLEALKDQGKLEKITVGRSHVYRPVSRIKV